MKLPTKCKKCKVRQDIKEEAHGFCAICFSIINTRASKAPREYFCPLCGGLHVDVSVTIKGICKQCKEEFFKEIE